MKYKILALLLLLQISNEGKAWQGRPQSVPVIFDTDIGNDIDDVLALQMLFNYEKQGRVKLLGITISKSNPRVIDYIDGYCRWNGRKKIPLGYAYNGVNPEPGKYVPATLDTLIEGKKILHPRRKAGTAVPEGYRLQRKLLAAQADQSVVLIVVGPETNIARLLQSGPDEYSSLNGIELVKQKVRLVSVMGGLYAGDYNFPEWNIVQDLKAAQTLFSLCPVPLVASGFEIGVQLNYPASSILTDFRGGAKNPLVVSYKIYDKMPYDRPTWDLTSVLYALEPDRYFQLSPPGKISIDETGKSVYRTGVDQGAPQYYLSLKNNIPEIRQALINQVTGKKK